MPIFRLAVSTVSALCLAAMTGCAGTVETAPEPAPLLVAPAPEALNIPEPVDEQAGCDCDAATVAVENHFDRGVRALAARDYARARVYFERHRDEGDEQSRREADVGIAFVTLLDRSEAGEQAAGASGVDERAEVMILAMAAVELLEGQLERLAELNRALAGDLEKREEALKRLRDLTLGQGEG